MNLRQLASMGFEWTTVGDKIVTISFNGQTVYLNQRVIGVREIVEVELAKGTMGTITWIYPPDPKLDPKDQGRVLHVVFEGQPCGLFLKFEEIIPQETPQTLTPQLAVC